MLRVPSLLGLIALSGLACGVGSADAPWLTRPTRDTHDSLFPIERGAHDGLDCDTCHEGTETFLDVRCTNCHSHAAAETDALHTGLDDYVHEGNACFDCHPRGTVEAFEGHEDIFPVADGTPHGDVGCAECHTSRADRTQVTCIDCHAHAQPEMDAAHGAVAEYAYATSACRSCHPDGTVSIDREAHADAFPITEDTTHGDSGCADCHVNPTDRGVLECSGCHAHARSEAAADHSRVGDFAADAASCLLCHPLAVVYDVSDHVPFRIDARSDHRPEEAGCLDCHTGRIFERDFPAADFDSLDCAECHSRSRMDDKHDEEPGYRYEPRTCIQSGCHPTGEEAEDD